MAIRAGPQASRLRVLAIIPIEILEFDFCDCSQARRLRPSSYGHAPNFVRSLHHRRLACVYRQLFQLKCSSSTFAIVRRRDACGPARMANAPIMIRIKLLPDLKAELAKVRSGAEQLQKDCEINEKRRKPKCFVNINYFVHRNKLTYQVFRYGDRLLIFVCLVSFVIYFFLPLQLEPGEWRCQSEHFLELHVVTQSGEVGVIQCLRF